MIPTAPTVIPAPMALILVSAPLALDDTAAAAEDAAEEAWKNERKRKEMNGNQRKLISFKAELSTR